MALAEAAGSRLEQASGELFLSIFLQPDDVREALSAAIEAAELARRAGHRGLEITNLLNGAELSILLGEWAHTRVAFIELGQRDLAGHQRPWLEWLVAMLTALTGDPSEASARLEQHADLAAATEFVASRTTYLQGSRLRQPRGRQPRSGKPRGGGRRVRRSVGVQQSARSRGSGARLSGCTTRSVRSRPCRR